MTTIQVRNKPDKLTVNKFQNEKYRCFFCDKTFPCDRDLEHHLESICAVHLQGSYKYKNRLCQKCAKKFPSYSAYGLISHVNACAGKRPPLKVYANHLDLLREIFAEHKALRNIPHNLAEIDESNKELPEIEVSESIQDEIRNQQINVANIVSDGNNVEIENCAKDDSGYFVGTHTVNKGWVIESLTVDKALKDGEGKILAPTTPMESKSNQDKSLLEVKRPLPSIQKIISAVTDCPTCMEGHKTIKHAQACLRSHQLIRCLICLQVTSAEKHKVLDHNKRFHLIPGKPGLVACPFCSKLFDYKQGINIHMAKMHMRKSLLNKRVQEDSINNNVEVIEVKEGGTQYLCVPARAAATVALNKIYSYRLTPNAMDTDQTKDDSLQEDRVQEKLASGAKVLIEECSQEVSEEFTNKKVVGTLVVNDVTLAKEQSKSKLAQSVNIIVKEQLIKGINSLNGEKVSDDENSLAQERLTNRENFSGDLIEEENLREQEKLVELENLKHQLKMIVERKWLDENVLQFNGAAGIETKVLTRKIESAEENLGMENDSCSKECSGNGYQEKNELEICQKNIKWKTQELLDYIRKTLGYCTKCKKQYRQIRRATLCLNSHGLRRCWICFKTVRNDFSSFWKHSWPHFSEKVEMVSCTICGKLCLYDMSINVHMGHHLRRDRKDVLSAKDRCKGNRSTKWCPKNKIPELSRASAVVQEKKSQTSKQKFLRSLRVVQDNREKMKQLLTRYRMGRKSVNGNGIAKDKPLNPLEGKSSQHPASSVLAPNMNQQLKNTSEVPKSELIPPRRLISRRKYIWNHELSELKAKEAGSEKLEEDCNYWTVPQRHTMNIQIQGEEHQKVRPAVTPPHWQACFHCFLKFPTTHELEEHLMIRCGQTLRNNCLFSIRICLQCKGTFSLYSLNDFFRHVEACRSRTLISQVRNSAWGRASSSISREPFTNVA